MAVQSATVRTILVLRTGDAGRTVTCASGQRGRASSCLLAVSLCAAAASLAVHPLPLPLPPQAAVAREQQQAARATAAEEKMAELERLLRVRMQAEGCRMSPDCSAGPASAL